MVKSMPTGIYKCINCNINDVVHKEGAPFAPCGNCKSNKSWKLVRQTKGYTVHYDYILTEK